VRSSRRWRYISHAADGSEYPFRGEYLEVVPPVRLVQTFVFDAEGCSDHAAVVIGVLEEHEGKTRLTSTTAFQTTEELEGFVDSAAKGGNDGELGPAS
jgi:uncharacterized protein YndB with AHSA1/START domain